VKKWGTKDLDGLLCIARGVATVSTGAVCRCFIMEKLRMNRNRVKMSIIS